jgi:hypothetical protein
MDGQCARRPRRRLDRRIDDQRQTQLARACGQQIGIGDHDPGGRARLLRQGHHEIRTDPGGLARRDDQGSVRYVTSRGGRCPDH